MRRELRHIESVQVALVAATGTGANPVLGLVLIFPDPESCASTWQVFEDALLHGRRWFDVTLESGVNTGLRIEVETDSYSLELRVDGIPESAPGRLRACLSEWPYFAILPAVRDGDRIVLLAFEGVGGYSPVFRGLVTIDGEGLQGVANQTWPTDQLFVSEGPLILDVAGG